VHRARLDIIKLKGKCATIRAYSNYKPQRQVCINTALPVRAQNITKLAKSRYRQLKTM